MIVLDVAELHDLFVEAAETDRRLPPAIKKQKMAMINKKIRMEWIKTINLINRMKNKKLILIKIKVST